MGYNHKYIENLKIKVINSILTPRRNPNNDKLTIYWKLPYIAKFESLNKKVVNNINSVIEATRTKFLLDCIPMLCTNVLVVLIVEKLKDICLRG